MKLYTIEQRKFNFKSKRGDEADNELVVVVAENQSSSTQAAATVLGVSQTLILALFHDDLHFKTYKFHDWHK